MPPFFERNPVHGNCPECGELFESIGSASLSIAIGNHLYEEHGYPTRFWVPGNLGPGGHPALAKDVPVSGDTRKALPPAPGSPLLAKYVGTDADGLTPYDRGRFLAPLNVAWRAPASWPRCEDWPVRKRRLQAGE